MAKAELRITGAKRLKAQNKAISVTLNKDFSKESVEKAFDFARRIAPYKSGATKDAIQKIIQKNSGRVVLYQPNHRDGRNRPYHMWFHGIKAPSPTGKNGAGRGYDLRKGKYRPKSGIPDFMDKTFIYMQNQSRDGIQKQLQTIFK